jgi:hypothetical protein
MARAADLKDDLIIAALLEQRTVTAASAQCGVSTNVIYRKLKSPAFSKKYAAASRALLKKHTAQLQCFAGEAIETLAEVMRDKDNPPQTRVNAAAEILRSCGKFTETVDLIGEIEELENMQL